MLYAGIGSNLLSLWAAISGVGLINLSYSQRYCYILRFAPKAHAISALVTKRSHICLSDEEYRYLYWVLAIGTYPQVI